MKIDHLIRKVPFFKGKLRLVNYLSDRSLTDVYIDSNSGKFYLPNLLDHQYFELFANGYYEANVVDYIIKSIPRNGCLLDVGANIGSIAIPVAIARPDVKIVSIEALPRMFSYLKRNVELNNLNNIILLNVCCSNVEGRVVKFYNHKTKVSSSSFHSLHSSEYIELVTKTVDQQLKELNIDCIDFLKIDTEGSEALIFQGSIEMLQRDHPIVLFEFNEAYEKAIENLQPGNAQRLLIDIGYKLYHFDKFPFKNKLDSPLINGSAELLALPTNSDLYNS